MSKSRPLARGGIALSVTAAVLLFACTKKEAAHPQQSPAQPAAAVAPAPVDIALSGKIQALQVMSVSSPVAGVVQQFLADVGDEVSVGEVLARVTNAGLEEARQSAELAARQAHDRIAALQPAIIAARLEVSRSEADATRARLEFEKADKTYQRQQILWKEGITPRLTYEKAGEDYAAQKSESEDRARAAKDAVERVPQLAKQLEDAQHDLDENTRALQAAQIALNAEDVRSPAAGLVIERSVQPGASVNTASELLRIATDLNSLAVALMPDRVTAERIHAGQAAMVQAGGDPPVRGRVSKIEAGQVLVEFSSASPSVRPGMTAQVRIVP